MHQSEVSRRSWCIGMHPTWLTKRNRIGKPDPSGAHPKRRGDGPRTEATGMHHSPSESFGLSTNRRSTNSTIPAHNQALIQARYLKWLLKPGTFSNLAVMVRGNPNKTSRDLVRTGGPATRPHGSNAMW